MDLLLLLELLCLPTAPLIGTYAEIDQAGSYSDYEPWTAAGTVVWEPEENLPFGMEAGYEKINGNGLQAASFLSKYRSAEQAKIVGIPDDSVWVLMFRAQRSF